MTDCGKGFKAFVYAIRHELTGKVYVGCTKDVERRIKEHLRLLKANNHPIKQMQDDYNRYGGEYSYYILFNAYAAYDAFLMERHFMTLLDSRNPQNGYNSQDNSNNFSLSQFRKKSATKLLKGEESDNRRNKRKRTDMVDRIGCCAGS